MRGMGRLLYSCAARGQDGSYGRPASRIRAERSIPYGDERKIGHKKAQKNTKDVVNYRRWWFSCAFCASLWPVLAFVGQSPQNSRRTWPARVRNPVFVVIWPNVPELMSRLGFPRFG